MHASWVTSHVCIVFAFGLVGIATAYPPKLVSDESVKASSTQTRNFALNAEIPNRMDRNMYRPLNGNFLYRVGRGEACPWGCTGSNDNKLDNCETKCKIDYAVDNNLFQVCLEECATRYISCLTACA